MKKPSILLLLIACGFLVAIFFAPLWHIKLNAPQYPEGLDMYIWVNKITGTDDFTLQNINILNHYVGMRAIEPNSFKELEIMPYFVLFFIVSGVVIAFINRKKLTMAWLAVLIICGTIGLIDFYLWQQDFGHNLDPQAPIKMEGMSYSPPFIGVKHLLNITARSFPDWGAIFFGIALGFAIIALFLKNKDMNRNLSKKLHTVGVAAIMLLMFASCQPSAEAIDYGFDSCTHCKMTIADNRFGTELVTQKGKVYKFDAIECMAQYLQDDSDVHALQLVTDLSTPGVFIDAQKATYLQSEALPSPMGMNLSAYKNEADAKSYLNNMGGKMMNWDEVKKLGNVEY